MGSARSIDTVRLAWEVAYGKEHAIQVSGDGTAWRTVAQRRGPTGPVTGEPGPACASAQSTRPRRALYRDGTRRHRLRNPNRWKGRLGPESARARFSREPYTCRRGRSRGRRAWTGAGPRARPAGRGVYVPLMRFPRVLTGVAAVTLLSAGCGASETAQGGGSDDAAKALPVAIAGPQPDVYMRAATRSGSPRPPISALPS